MGKQDTGNFQINNVVLTVPPQNIKVSRNAFNSRYQTLRTRNSMKTKSGHSVINIAVTTKFVGNSDWRKLRELMAQFRVTPFCYIDNDFLRQTVLEGENYRGDSIVLALKSISITKNNETTNCIDVTMNFMWFNYRPYTQLWLYRLDMFSPLAVHDPRSSRAWSILTDAELNRDRRNGDTRGYSKIGILDDIVELGYWEFIVPDIDENKKPADFIKDFESYQDYINQESFNMTFDYGLNIDKQGSSEFEAGKTAYTKANEYMWDFSDDGGIFKAFGYTTSITPKSNFFSNLTKTMGENVYSYRGLDWEPLFTKNRYGKEEPLLYNGNPVFRRRKLFNTNEEDIIVTGVTIEFAHNLVTVPILGYSYATCQHLGSNDAVVSFQAITTDNTALGKLSRFYNDIEESAIKFRAIPPDQRRMKIRNDIVNMCNIHDCMVEQLHIETVPGQVETYAINMVLSDDRFQFVKSETLNQEKVPTESNVYNKIVQKAVENISWQAALYKWKKNDISFARLKSALVDKKTGTGYEDTHYRTGTIREGGFNINYKLQNDQRRALVARFAEEYAVFMQRAYEKLEPWVNVSFARGFGASHKGGAYFAEGNVAAFNLTAIFSLKEEQLPGINKIQLQLMDRVFLGKDNLYALEHYQRYGNTDDGFDQIGTFALTEEDSLNPDFGLKKRVVDVKVGLQEYLSTSSDVWDLKQKLADIRKVPGWSGLPAYKNKYDELVETYQEELDDLREKAATAFKEELSDVIQELHNLKEDQKRLNKAAQSKDAVWSEFDVGNYFEKMSLDYQESATRHVLEEKGFAPGFNDTLIGIFSDYRDLMDKWAGRMIEAPEMEHLREQLFNSFRLNPGSVAYPDFPSQAVIDHISNESDDPVKDFSSIAKILYELWKSKGDALKGIGPTALINPDFYLINEVTDLSGNIFSSTDVTRIKEITKQSLINYDQTRWDWLKKLKAKGDLRKRERLGKMKTEVKLSWDSFKSWFTNLFEDNEKTAANTTLLEYEAKAQPMKDNGEAPYDFLTGDTAVSAIQSLNEDGDTISLIGTSKWLGVGESIGQNALIKKTRGYDSERHIDDTYITKIDGGKGLKKASRSIDYDIVHYYDGQALLNDLSIKTRKRSPIDPQTKNIVKVWPVDGKRITSTFQDNRVLNSQKQTAIQEGKKQGLTDRQIRLKVKNLKGHAHHAVDLVTSSWPRKGTPIKAAANGKIVDVQVGSDKEAEAYLDYFKAKKKYQATNASPEKIAMDKAYATWKATPKQKATIITIDHGDELPTLKTRYVHLDNDVFVYMWQDLLKKDPNNSALKVTAGQHIGSMGNTGHSRGAHLHWEVIYKGKKINPAMWMEGVIQYSVPGKRDGVSAEGPVEKSIKQYETSVLSGSMRGVNRAFPTFKLYFIESDREERRTFGFDDFFSYAAVRDIRIIKNKDIPGDLLILELTNIAGTLSNRRFKNRISRGGFITANTRGTTGKREDPKKPLNRDTEEENPLLSILLQPGIQIQLKLGYHNNPAMLDTQINGEITDVQFSENDDLVTVICQSYGAELVQSIKAFKSGVKIENDTRKICEEMMASPELKHFGRYEPMSEATTGVPYDLLKDVWKLVDSPQDDNIFCPDNNGFNLYRRSPDKFLVYRTTVWNVFKEMTLRHPGFVAQALPYEGYWGPRMTMYFGLPSQLYFARDPKASEQKSVDKLREILKEAESKPEFQTRYKNGVAKLLTNSQKDISPEEFKRLQDATGVDAERLKIRAQFIDKFLRVFHDKTSIVRSFRDYHLLTSNENIIANNIKTNSHKTPNTVNIGYSEDGYLSNGKAAITFSGNLDTTHEDVFTMKYDDDLPDEEMVQSYYKYPNAFGEEQVKRYALSILWESMKQAYEGTIIVTGNPRIKPTDICYIADDYNDIYGQIEVKQVVHRFSMANGFITEITPMAVVHINQTATMTVNEIMSMMAAQALSRVAGDSAAQIYEKGINKLRQLDFAVDRTLDAIPGIQGIRKLARTSNQIVKTAITWPAWVPLWGMELFITHSQYAHPFRFEPLVYRNQPMMRGLKHTRKPKGLFYKIEGLFREGSAGLNYKVDKWYADIDPHNWVNVRGDIFRTLTGEST